MGGEFDPEVLRNYALRRRLADGGLPEMSIRAVVWELAREDALDGRLSWFRRRTLARYGASLGIPAAESQLLVNAAEWEALHGDPDPTGPADPAAILACVSEQSISVSPTGLVAWGILAAIADALLLLHLLK